MEKIIPESLFSLPPVGQRRARAPFFNKLLDESGGSRIHENDSYITYIVVRNALTFSAAIGFVLLLLTFLNPSLVHAVHKGIDSSWHHWMLSHQDEPKSIVISFAYVFSVTMGVLIIGTLPYYLALVFRHVDLKRVDLFRFYRRYYPTQTKAKRVFVYGLASVSSVALTFWSYAVPAVIADYASPLADLYNSYVLLLLSYAMQVVGFGATAMINYGSVLFLIYMTLGYDHDDKH